jgi:hypothetical protein
MNSASTPSKASQPALHTVSHNVVCLLQQGPSSSHLDHELLEDLPTTFVVVDDDDDDGSDLISSVLLSSVLHRRDPLQMTDDAG